jgi:glycine/D-amino acid oxidase-like deaminating enzyme
MRVHQGKPDDPVYVPHHADKYADQPTGCDLILAPSMIRKHFPYLSKDTVALLHTRRCGWFSGQQLGMLLFEKAVQGGTRFIKARVEGISLVEDRVDKIQLRHDDSIFNVTTKTFVNAAGPYLQHVSHLLEVELSVYCEPHHKISIKDHDRVIPRDAPLLIWEDPQQLSWDQDERQMLADSENDRTLLEELPPGPHLRPEGGSDSNNILMLWPYHLERVQPIFPVPSSPSYPEVVLRGLTTMIPDLNTYLNKMPKPFIDGGYYTKTPENRLLACPLPIEGSYVLGALSGYGLMAACGAAELLAAHISKSSLPAYARAFMLERYEDPGYLRTFTDWEHSGQL